MTCRHTTPAVHGDSRCARLLQHLRKSDCVGDLWQDAYLDGDRHRERRDQPGNDPSDTLWLGQQECACKQQRAAVGASLTIEQGEPFAIGSHV